MSYISTTFHPRELEGDTVAETQTYLSFPFKNVKVKGLDGAKHVLTVVHIDDYGVIVIGAGLVGMCRKAMKKVGYDEEELMGWAYRPMMVDQVWSADGHAVAGRPAVAFYFGGR